MVQDYRDLIIWQKAIDLVPEVYRLIKRFPKEETYALADQVRRAAVSIPANIAEGQARQHTREFLQHLSVARGSLGELDTLLIVASRLGYLTEYESAELERSLLDLRRPLITLILRLREKVRTRSDGWSDALKQQGAGKSGIFLSAESHPYSKSKELLLSHLGLQASGASGSDEEKRQAPPAGT